MIFDYKKVILFQREGLLITHSPKCEIYSSLAQVIQSVSYVPMHVAQIGLHFMEKGAQ